MKLVNTYVLPANGGSRGLAAHRLGLIEVSLPIRSCQLKALGTGNPVKVHFAMDRAPKGVQVAVEFIV
jgi:hypothetical protein